MNVIQMYELTFQLKKLNPDTDTNVCTHSTVFLVNDEIYPAVAALYRNINDFLIQLLKVEKVEDEDVPN